MAEQASNIERFRELIGNAPELTEPLVVGPERWPFEVCKIDEEKGRGVLETRPNHSGRFARVEYDTEFKLAAKRILSLYQVEEDENLIDSGQIRYDLGEVEIALQASYSSVFLPPELTRAWLNEPRNFQITIGVHAKKISRESPPIAIICYSYSSQIPINVDFLYGDYRDALAGNTEVFDLGPNTAFSGRYEPRITYFQWEHLVGAKVGVTRFKEGDQFIRSRRRLTQINSPASVPLEETPYTQKITQSSRRRRWGEGKLRFSRMDQSTGESWMFSVPEWMDNREFIDALRGRSLEDFAIKYPAVFCVKEREKPRKWFSAGFQRDRAR